MNESLLQVENLKTYFFTRRGVIKAVDGVSFSIKAGETLGLVGESGCGKSITSLSLLRLVPQPAGRIVAGSIILDNEELLSKSEAEMRKIRGKKIAMILQDPMTSLNPSLTINEQIAEIIRLHQGVRDKAALRSKVVEALRLVRIPAPETRLNDYPHQFSGGMRQRVVGAIALSCHPLLLIADEPTTSLDVTTQAQYLNLLKHVQQESKTAMMFITHDLGIVSRVCDRVAVMYTGKIVESTETRELFDNPLHPYTSALLQSIPRLDTKVDRLFSIAGQPTLPIDLPPGCAFAARCSKARERCHEEYPPQVVVDGKHRVSCWKYV